MLKGKKILFVTSVNMAANPRCLKEVKSASMHGADVTVLKCAFNNWSNSYEREIEQRLPNVHWISVNATRTPFMKWAMSTFFSVIAGKLISLNKNSTRLLSYSLDKRSVLLKQALGKIDADVDFVIAHNPGAFYPAWNFARKHSIKLGIDVEDYHPGENAVTEKAMKQLMAKTLSSADYITAASPLILKYTLQDVDVKGTTEVINNVFSLKEQPAFNSLPLEKDNELRLFWFSQHVGMDRGIEDAIDAMNLIDKFGIQLTLMGNCSQSVCTALKGRLKNGRHKIVFKDPVPQSALIEESSQHHIGLALEKSPNLNRALCLTNKLFTYLLAGNAIIASDTPAQKLFMETYGAVGEVYKQDNADALAAILIDLYDDPNKLTACRKAAYNLSLDKLNWETEEKTFLQLLK